MNPVGAGFLSSAAVGFAFDNSARQFQGAMRRPASRLEGAVLRLSLQRAFSRLAASVKRAWTPEGRGLKPSYRSVNADKPIMSTEAGSRLSHQKRIPHPNNENLFVNSSKTDVDMNQEIPLTLNWTYTKPSVKQAFPTQFAKKRRCEIRLWHCGCLLIFPLSGRSMSTA